MNVRKVTAALTMLAAAPAAVLLVSACGGKAAKDAKSATVVRSTALEHEPCDGGGNRVESLDANGDGKPDVQRMSDSKSGAEKCRTSDLNHDGKPDLYEYFDAGGNVRRREASFDDTGAIMSIEYFANGKRVRRELDTTGQRKIDTWDTFDAATGKLLTRERDSSGDGVIDQWWSWDGDKVTIAIDRNGDGRPDPEATITVNGSSSTYGATGGMVAGAADAGAPDAAAPEPKVNAASSASMSAVKGSVKGSDGGAAAAPSTAADGGAVNTAKGAKGK